MGGLIDIFFGGSNNSGGNNNDKRYRVEIINNRTGNRDWKIVYAPNPGMARVKARHGMLGHYSAGDVYEE